MSEKKTPYLATIYECGSCGTSYEPCVHWSERQKEEQQRAEKDTKICAACNGAGRVSREIKVHVHARGWRKT
jgi:hypothetical protein